MSLFYKIAYGIGFTPWEHAAVHAPAATQVANLFDREERRLPRPLGNALDLGCGTGHWSVELARRGWSVTGIDLIGKAIATARRRALRAGVTARFIEGDITRLAATDVRAPVQFIWDFGTIHGLTPSQRFAVAQGIDLLAPLGATMLMLAWTPGRRGPLPSGMNRQDIEATFESWTVLDETPFDASGLPAPLKNVAPRIYRLRRHGTGIRHELRTS